MILKGDRLILGACYYPEHWPESMWREDLRRMLDTGIEVIRIAEFAWNKIEPREGVFDYSFFDRFLDMAEEEGMKVIFCTPTATPPAWLTEKYPEALNADIDGTLFYHGARRHYNYNSPIYRELSARITEKSASHYAPRPCVIGWQIDNEVNCETDFFYSESDHNAFRVFLQEKYGTLDELNRAWGTAFWNQTYTDWQEVHAPRKTYTNSTNPHEVLDYYRFISHSARSFVKLQSDIIAKYKKPGDFITTNGLFGHLDNHRMTAESLDFMTYDSYPNFAYSQELYAGDSDVMKDRKWSRNLSEVRSISPVFGIMEQQSGANGWNSRMEAPSPRPGQITLWTMQSIAHGADYVSYFRWRTCTMGTEIYWHGILDYSSRENRRLREVRDIHRKLQALGGLAGSRYQARVGMIRDYDNIWDAQLDIWHGRLERQSQKAFFEAAQLTHTPFDYVYLREDTTPEELAGYTVLFYPHAAILTEKQAKLLERYVENGGILVAGCRNGYKNIDGQCVRDELPGLLSGLTGTAVAEYTPIAPDTGAVFINWDGDRLPASEYVEELEAAPGARTAGVYEQDYYQGSGALIENRFGKGTAYYYGSAYTVDAVKTFLKKLGVASPWAGVVQAPQECELAVREKDGRQYLFLLNYSPKAVGAQLLRPGKNLYTGETVSGSLELGPYGTAVIELT